MKEIKSTNSNRCNFGTIMQDTNLNYYHKCTLIPEELESIEEKYCKLTRSTDAENAGIRIGKESDPFESLKRKRDGGANDCIKSIKIVSGEVEKMQKMVFDCTHNGKEQEACGDCCQIIVALGVIRADIQTFFDEIRKDKK
jgi:hypothetical protein